MRTVIETPTFQKAAARLWSDEERVAFIDWIAINPLAGDVIPGADGARKIRWSRSGSGKSGEVADDELLAITRQTLDTREESVRLTKLRFDTTYMQMAADGKL